MSRSRLADKMRYNNIMTSFQMIISPQVGLEEPYNSTYLHRIGPDSRVHGAGECFRRYSSNRIFYAVARQN